jgi:hypothetical protein
MKRFLLALLCCGLALNGWTQRTAPASDEKAERLQFLNTDVRDVLAFYGDRASKRVFMAPEVEGRVTLEHTGPRAESLSVIGKALQEQLGVAMRDTSGGVILVERWKDPEWPPDRERPITGAVRKLLPREGDRTAELKLRKAAVREAAVVYGKLVNKPVFLAPSLSAIVTIEHFGLREGFPNVMRTALLEKYGIEISETPQGDILFNWSEDPKHPRRSERPIGGGELPFLPVMVLIVDESGLPLRGVTVRLDDPNGTEPLQPPDEVEKVWMERVARPATTDERGAAVLFYRGRMTLHGTNTGLFYARPIRGTVVVDSPEFDRAEYSLSDAFGRTALQPPAWAPLLKIVLKRRTAK